MTDRIRELEEEVERLNKVNRVLMERVERSVDSRGDAYGIFEENVLLQRRVAERTSALEQANLKMAKLLEQQQAISNDLLKSQSRFEQVSEQSGTYSWEVDADGLYRYVSPSVTKVLGYAPDEMVGHMHFYDLQPETGRAAFKELGLGLMERREAVRDLQSQVLTKDGRLIWIMTNGLPQLEEAGNLLGYWGSDTDITERHAAEDRLSSFTDCLLGFGTEATSNMQRVMEWCGRMLDASCGLYNRLDNGLLKIMVGWQLPADMPLEDDPEGHICCDLIKNNADEPLVLRDLDQTPYAQTDPNVARYGLKSYIGIVVRLRGEPVGALCVVYQRDVDVGPEHLMFLKLAAFALGIEEGRRLSEVELRGSDELLKKLSEQLPGSIYQFKYTADGRMFCPYASAHFADMFEVRPEDVRDNIDAVFARIHSEDAATVLERVEQSRTTLTPWACDFRVNLPTRGLRWLTGTAQPEALSNGDMIWYGYITDITARKEIEIERERLSRAIEQSGETVVITDGEGTIIYANHAFEVSSGYTREEALGQNPRILQSGQHDPAFYEQMWEILLSGTRWEGEIVNRRKTGELYTEHATISPVLDAQGCIRHYVAVKRDITENKRAEAALIATNQDLEEAIERANLLAIKAETANMAKSDFLANMSHEIRTPMNGVIGMTELLLDSGLNEEQSEFAQIIMSSASSLLSLLNDILDFSKIEAGRISLEAIDFSLRSMVTAALSTVSVQARDKGLTFTCEIEPEVPDAVCGDPTRVRQVLVNIISNAIKFTEQGSVTVRVECVPGASDIALRFSIQDTGIGIPREKLSILFQKFSQADSSTTRRFGGTGLGLAISKQLVEMMGGDIRVDSEEGRGSTFYFTLHLQPGSEVKEDEVVVGDVEGKEGARVLVVEDNPTNRIVALGMLKKMGMAAEAVENGSEALEAIALKNYDVVLMDAQMPVMDGYTATRSIRRQEKQRDDGKPPLPVIAMTAHAMQGDREKCIQEGMSDYIAKPISLETLREVLGRWLPESGTHRGSEESSLIGEIRWRPDVLLQRLMDDEELLWGVVDTFLEDVPNQVQATANLLEIGNQEGVRTHAHSIKGAAANVGGTDLFEAAATLERQAIEGQLEEGDKLLEKVQEAFERLKLEMRYTKEHR
jgi:PAS domain S-box-containing protein